MARPKKQVITPPVPDEVNTLDEPVTQAGPAPVEREDVLIKNHTTYDYHVRNHAIPSKREYLLPGDIYRQYVGRPAFDGMFEDGLLEIVK